MDTFLTLTRNKQLTEMHAVFHRPDLAFVKYYDILLIKSQRTQTDVQFTLHNYRLTSTLLNCVHTLATY